MIDSAVRRCQLTRVEEISKIFMDKYKVLAYRNDSCVEIRFHYNFTDTLVINDKIYVLGKEYHRDYFDSDILQYRGDSNFAQKGNDLYYVRNPNIQVDFLYIPSDSLHGYLGRL